MVNSGVYRWARKKVSVMVAKMAKTLAEWKDRLTVDESVSGKAFYVVDK